jgi:hypothetical protein
MHEDILGAFEAISSYFRIGRDSNRGFWLPIGADYIHAASSGTPVSNMPTGGALSSGCDGTSHRKKDISSCGVDAASFWVSCPFVGYDPE